MAELALENAERMLDLGPDHCDDAIDPFVEGMQRAALGALRMTAQTLPGALNAASRSAQT